PLPQMDTDFVEFVHFLRLLERSRGERSEVGGLPVFLVLTKCDLLAESTDTPAKWLERIAERTKLVHDRFQLFLTRQQEAGDPLPFGQIDFHMNATAVKRPALADVAAKPREPYGVAELFRQCLDAAREFRTRRYRSSRLLLWTAGGAGVVIAGMLGLAIALIGGMGQNERRPGALETRIESFQSTDGESPAERFRGNLGNLEQKLALLEEFKRDPEFANL